MTSFTRKGRQVAHCEGSPELETHQGAGGRYDRCTQCSGDLCAAAGIIVGVVTLTGLGLKFSSIVIVCAGGNLILTAIYTALIVWVVGLAVPVTAGYIICAMIAAPAMIQLGVPDFAAHMFIFYYAVLSEVSPPTALSPFVAAAITGGDPCKTTLQSWKYTLPALIVPFIFVLGTLGAGVLLKLPQGASWFDVAGVIALAVGVIVLQKLRHDETGASDTTGKFAGF